MNHAVLSKPIAAARLERARHTGASRLGSRAMSADRLYFLPIPPRLAGTGS